MKNLVGIRIDSEENIPPLEMSNFLDKMRDVETLMGPFNQLFVHL